MSDRGIELAGDERWTTADGVAFRFVDEPDVGDLYNFCPRDGAAPGGPRGIRVEGSRVFVSFDGVEIALRLSQRHDEPFIRVGGEIRNQDIRRELEPLAARVSFAWIRKAAARVDELAEFVRRNIQKTIALDALIMELRALAQ